MKTEVKNNNHTIPIDLVNRFALTHLQRRFNVSGSAISLATNCPDLLSQMANLATECEQAVVGLSECSWRIVIEPETDETLESVAFGCRYVSDDGISFVTIGQRGFLAYDERTRKGISFVSERLIRNRTLFTESFLPSFLSLLPEKRE